MHFVSMEGRESEDYLKKISWVIVFRRLVKWMS